MISTSHFISSRHVFTSARGLLTSACLGLGLVSLTSCGEEPPPPPNNAPTVIGSESYALCDRRDEAFALVEVSFVIEDLEGSDTLSAPYVEFGALQIPVEMEAIPAPTDEERAAFEEAQEAAGEMADDTSMLPECPVESCRARYTWSYSPSDTDTALVICPEGAPDLLVRIFDRDTNSKEFFLAPQRGE